MLTPEQVSSIKQQLREQIEKLPEEQQENFMEQIENATPEQLEAFIKQQGAGTGECLFCGIGKGTVETVKVYEDQNVVAFLDITPSVPGQTIIIPKEHYQFIFQMPDQILWEMAKVMKLVTPVIVNVTKAQGISVYIAQGPAAGQRVGHVAINLIPRFEGDKAMFAWERNEIATKELEKAAKEIRIGIEKILAEEKAKVQRKVMESAAPAAPKKEETLPEYPRRRA